jgi:hypothetical protein
VSQLVRQSLSIRAPVEKVFAYLDLPETASRSFRNWLRSRRSSRCRTAGIACASSRSDGGGSSANEVENAAAEVEQEAVRQQADDEAGDDQGDDEQGDDQGCAD